MLLSLLLKVKSFLSLIETFIQRPKITVIPDICTRKVNNLFIIQVGNVNLKM